MKITVDIDSGDFGGRTKAQQGLDEGLPKILELFAEHNIKAIFFIHPQVFRAQITKQIVERGHRIGLHPTKIYQEPPYIMEFIRGHKFYKFPDWQHYLPYSSPKNHTSLLKHMWLKKPLQDIFYLHPFDIVKPKTKPPNLFCKLWYSQPERAYETLKNIIAKSAERK